MPAQAIKITGARQHNLKNLTLEIPREKLVVITGLSGSGKSSLAFDTLYAEGQRKYVESLSAYARQFLDQMQKPDVDFIEGLSPAIAIEQRSAATNPRSTIATTTEIYDYLRLLFSSVGQPHDPNTGEPIFKQTPQQIVDQILAYPPETKIVVLAPIIRGQVGEFRDVIEKIKREGFVRARLDGEMIELNRIEPIRLEKTKAHNIEIVVDRLIIREGVRQRLADSVDTALKWGGSRIFVLRQVSGRVGVPPAGSGVSPEPSNVERQSSPEAAQISPRDAAKGGQDAHPTRDNGNANPWQELKYSTDFCNPETEFTMPQLTPKHFSFNSHLGACPACHGLGTELVLDCELMIPDPGKSLDQGAVAPWRKGVTKRMQQYYAKLLIALARHFNVPTDVPYEKLPDAFKQALCFGTNEPVEIALGKDKEKTSVNKPFEGLVRQLQRLYDETESELTRHRIRQYMSRRECAVCLGARLRPEILGVTVRSAFQNRASLSSAIQKNCHSERSEESLAISGSTHGVPGNGERFFADAQNDKKWSAAPERAFSCELNIRELCQLTISEAKKFVENLVLTEQQRFIVSEVLREILARLGFLNEVGLGYLNLDRESGTLSGGEAQRIRLATQIGSGLAGVLYVLDEPSIGLHQRDNDRLIGTLRRLRDLGNSVIVVEHDEDTIRAADHVIDLGPGAGARGGELIAQGTVDEILQSETSATAQYLSHRLRIPVPKKRVPPKHWLTVESATENNLKNVTARFPLGCFTCVAGVSGSGKSTLVDDILRRALFRYFYNSKDRPGAHGRIDGLEFIDKAIVIDQSPIGRTPRSNPVTYTGAFAPIRTLFSQLPSARVRGYDSGRFSFNRPGGRCENCEGDGMIKIEMHFLADVYVECEVCRGKRYNRETLEVTYKGRNIADVLDMTVDEAARFFRAVPTISDRLIALEDVGLGYVRLGQAATTLSGGEAQRVKLAAELAKKATGRTVYILDEPTTGLHFADIHKLLEVLMKLRDAGNTLIVIEHNLEVIKCADWILDLGPEGGAGGGEIIAEGTPEVIADVKQSFTGRYLKPMLEK